MEARRPDKAPMTTFRLVLEGLMQERGVSGLPDLIRQWREAGYEVGVAELMRQFYGDTEYTAPHGFLIGVDEVLGTSPEEEVLLGVALAFAHGPVENPRAWQQLMRMATYLYGEERSWPEYLRVYV